MQTDKIESWIKQEVGVRVAEYYKSIESGLKIAHTGGFNRGADFG